MIANVPVLCYLQLFPGQFYVCLQGAIVIGVTRLIGNLRQDKDLEG